LTAIARKVRTLTGEFLYPKTDGLRTQRIFQDGFPDHEEPFPARHRLFPFQV
jgi:hypothetical protein